MFYFEVVVYIVSYGTLCIMVVAVVGEIEVELITITATLIFYVAPVIVGCHSCILL